MTANRVPAPAAPRSAAAAAVLTPKDIFGMLRRHIWLMISMAILGLVIGGAAWYLLKEYAPKYTAQTYIKVLPPIEKDPMIIGGGLVGRDLQYGHRSTIAALLTEQITLQQLVDRDKIQETEWFKNFGEIKAISILKAVWDLKKRFKAQALRDAEFVLVSMTCGDKKESALIVNEMVQLFLSSQGGSKRKELTERLAGFKSQKGSIQQELYYAEDALAEVRRASGFSNLGELRFQHTITQRLNNLEIQQNLLAPRIKQIQATIEILEEQAVGPITEQIARQIEYDPIMLRLGQQLTSLETSLSSRLIKFGENHRVVREIQELINATEDEKQRRKIEIAQQIRQSNLQGAQDELVIMLSRLEELQRLREEASAEQKRLDDARIEYEKRLKIRDERRDRLDEVKKTIEQLEVMHKDPQTPKVQFVAPAQEPLKVSSPKWKLYFSGGPVFGFLAGVALAFLIELLNDLVRTPRDIAKFLRIPLLGLIPDAAEDQQLQDVDLCHVVRQAPYSIVSEAYRRFRTNLKLFEFAKSSKAFLVTSGMAGDGRTSVAVNLATAFAAENKKVLLVDANFWRPNLHIIFPKPQAEQQAEFGLGTLLTGLCGYREVVRPSGIEGFDIIDAGPLPSNPSELLSGPQMEQMIKHQRQSYDYVIVDGPPILLVSGTKSLAKLVDGTILVFNAGATRRGAAVRIIRELRQVNATVVGCVLFAARPMKGGYFKEQFRFYQEYQKPQLELAQSI